MSVVTLIPPFRHYQMFPGGKVTPSRESFCRIRAPRSPSNMLESVGKRDWYWWLKPLPPHLPLLLFYLRVSAMRAWAHNDQLDEGIFGFLLASLGQCTHSNRKHAWGTWTAPSPAEACSVPAGPVISPSSAQCLYAVTPTQQFYICGWWSLILI